MPSKKRLISIAVYCLIIIILGLPSACGGVDVTGALIEMNIKPGDHISQYIKVQTDEGDLPMDFLVDIIGYGQSPQGGNTEINPVDDKSPYTARCFLNASPSRFHLAPGEEQNITIDCNIPAQIGAGGRYAIINIHSLPIGSGTVGICLAIDVPVRLIISGTKQVKTGKIESLTLDMPASGTQQNATLAFRNTGNTHYPIMVNASIEDGNGRVLARDSDPPASNIIPGGSRTVELYLRPETKLSSGMYSINAIASLEDGTPLARKEVSFKV